MNRDLRINAADDDEWMPSRSDVREFAEAILGRSAPLRGRGDENSSRHYELLEWVASFSDSHAEQLRQMRSAELRLSRQKALRQWVAQITGDSGQRPHSNDQAEASNDVDDISNCEEQWDSAKHPRLGRSPNPGWFATNAGTAAGGSQVATDFGDDSGESAFGSNLALTLASQRKPKGGSQGQPRVPANRANPTSSPKTSGSARARNNIRVGKGVGHHFASVSVIFDPEIRDSISKEAVRYAMGSYSGPTDPSHRFGTYGGVTHAQYNEYVRKELKRFIARRKIKKMTVEQMQEFIALINSGRDAYGKPHRQIAAFNKAIKATVPRGTKVPQTFEEVMAAGTKYLKHPRFRLALAGAFIANLLGEAVAQETELLNVASKSGHYKRAMRALDEGNLAEAHKLLLGNADSLYMEILSQVGATAALDFKRAMEEVFEAARNKAANEEGGE